MGSAPKKISFVVTTLVLRLPQIRVGNLRPPGRIRPAKLNQTGPQPLYQIVVTVYDQLGGIIFYDSAFLSTSCIEYLRGTIFEKPHCAGVR